MLSPLLALLPGCRHASAAQRFMRCATVIRCRSFRRQLFATAAPPAWQLAQLFIFH